jgi:hypothetical protein
MGRPHRDPIGHARGARRFTGRRSACGEGSVRPSPSWGRSPRSVGPEQAAGGKPEARAGNLLRNRQAGRSPPGGRKPPPSPGVMDGKTAREAISRPGRSMGRGRSGRPSGEGRRTFIACHMLVSNQIMRFTYGFDGGRESMSRVIHESVNPRESVGLAGECQRSATARRAGGRPRGGPDRAAEAAAHGRSRSPGTNDLGRHRWPARDRAGRGGED